MRKLLVTAALLTLSACSFVDDFNEMLEDQKRVQNIVKERYDLDSQFGINISNGSLMQVSITLNAADVRSQTVAELESTVAKVVSEVFDEEPQQVLIIVHN